MNHGSRVLAVTRPAQQRQAGVLAGMGAFSWEITPETQPSPLAPQPAASDFRFYNTPPAAPVAAVTPPASSGPGWLDIFGGVTKGIAAITPAVTGIIGMQSQRRAQDAANDLAQAQVQAQIAMANASASASRPSSLPSWVIPAAIGGVALLVGGFFLMKMPRSATNPRKRR